MVGENPGNHPTPVRKEASTEETWTIRDSFMIAGRRCWVGRLGRVRVWAGVAADGCRRPLLRHRSRRERDFRASGQAAGCPGVVPRAAVVRWTKRLYARTHKNKGRYGPIRPLAATPSFTGQLNFTALDPCGCWFLSPNNIAGWATAQTWVRSFSFSRATHRRHPESLPTDTQQPLCKLNNDCQRGRPATRWPATR